MKVAVLTTDRAHPVVPHIVDWLADVRAQGHDADLFHDRADVGEGDILFLVSCAQVIGVSIRRRFRATLVLHASDLPRGRGWSPHIWAIVDGASCISLCLLEAADPVDSGRVWLRTAFELEGHELLPEINAKLFAAELDLMSRAVHEFDRLQPLVQQGDPGEYMRKRTPEDSRLDPAKTIADQFDLLRVVDNDRYPAFFDHRGKRYVITIRKAES